jgi:hypothetical protein
MEWRCEERLFPVIPQFFGNLQKIAGSLSLTCNIRNPSNFPQKKYLNVGDSPYPGRGLRVCRAKGLQTEDGTGKKEWV